MNEKIMRYVGISVGVLLTLIILYTGAYIEIGIRNTIIYDIFRNFELNRELAHILWYLCLLIGFWLSWKYHFKTARIISKISAKIHKKA